MSNCSTWPIHRTRSGATIPDQSRPGRKANKKVLHKSTRAEASLQKCLRLSRTLIVGILPIWTESACVFYIALGFVLFGSIYFFFQWLILWLIFPSPSCFRIFFYQADKVHVFFQVFCDQLDRPNPLIDNFSSWNKTLSNLLARIEWTICIAKSKRILFVSFASSHHPVSLVNWILFKITQIGSSVHWEYRYIISENKILVAELTVIQILSGQETCKYPFRPLFGLKGWPKWPDLVEWLVISTSCIYKKALMAKTFT